MKEDSSTATSSEHSNDENVRHLLTEEVRTRCNAKSVSKSNARDSTAQYRRRLIDESNWRDKSPKLNGPLEVLPSNTFDKKDLWYPSESIKEDEKLQGGKWLLFQNGNRRQFDEYWRVLTHLCSEVPEITALKSSTAKVPRGVIRAYTKDFENREEVKMVGDAIMRATGYESKMEYKTNQASFEGRYVRLGYKNVTMYMHDGSNFYIRDANQEWIKWP